MEEFPKWIYKEGADLVWEGRKLAAKIVADAEAEAKAAEDGFLNLADYLKAEAEALAKKVKK